MHLALRNLCVRVAAIACLVLVALGVSVGRADARGFTVYVLGSSAVTPIETATNTAGSPIMLPAGLGTPTSIVTTPNGKTAYVGIPGSIPGTGVVPISLRTRSVGTPIAVVFSGDIAITPSGERVWAAWEQDLGAFHGALISISTRTNTVGSAVQAGSGASELAVTPNGRFAYVSLSDVFCSPCNTVSAVSLTGQAPLVLITVGNFPAGIAMMPRCGRAYVAVTGDDAVTPIDLRTNTPESQIPVGTSPVHIAITPNGRFAYVTNTGDSTVTPINLRTNMPRAPIPVSGGAGDIAITPDGRYAYVTNFITSTVTPINLATNTPGAPISVPAGADAITVGVPPPR